MSRLLDSIGVYPDMYPDQESYVSSEKARCLMFYDWVKPIGPEWLGVAAEIFAEFGQVISEGIGNMGAQHSYGRFSRIQKRLAGFLGTVQGSVNTSFDFDIEIKSQTSAESNAFFPSDLEMAWCVDAKGRKEGMIAVRDKLVDSCDSLIERIGKKIFGATGTTYANSFDFPTLFGPGYYRAGLGTIPSGMSPSSLVNEKYKTRITRWRDNRRDGLLTSQGYLREVYPLNFVLDAHLNMPFQGRPLSEYMKRVGNLNVSEYNDKMYRWTVPPERIDRVRQDLESSGIVLSSPQTPIPAHKRTL